MTALNIGHSTNSSSFSGKTDNTVDQIAKGQRVMQALQKMYERKLILQIKQTKRASQELARTEKRKFNRSDSQAWNLARNTK